MLPQRKSISVFTDRKKMDTVILFSSKSTARTDSMVKSLSAFRKPSFAFVTPADHLNLNGFRRVFESKQALDNLSTPSFNPSFSADFPQIPFWIQVKSEKNKSHSSEFFQPLSFGIAQWQFLLVVPCGKYQRKLEREKLVILDISSLPFLSSCHSSFVYFFSKWTDKLCISFISLEQTNPCLNNCWLLVLHSFLL